MSKDDTSQVQTMRAALLTGYGAPLALETVPRPMPKADEVLVKIEASRSEEHTSELQSLAYLVCRLLLEKKKKKT